MLLNSASAACFALGRSPPLLHLLAVLAEQTIWGDVGNEVQAGSLNRSGVTKSLGLEPAKSETILGVEQVVNLAVSA